MTLLGIILLLSITLGYFPLLGILLWAVFRNSCPRWACSLAAWIIVLGNRWIFNQWSINFNLSDTEPHWYFDLMIAIVNWALVSASGWISYLIIRKLANCIMTRKNSMAVEPG